MLWYYSNLVWLVFEASIPSVTVQVVQHKIVQIGPLIQKIDNSYKLEKVQLDMYNKTTIETETIVYDIVCDWQTVYKSITVVIQKNFCDFYI